MDRDVYDVLWAEIVGSHRLSMSDELKMLREAQERGIMLSVIYKLFLGSKKWKLLRSKILRRDGYACVKCGAKKFLQVDHKRYPKRIGDEQLEDLQTLCAVCHAQKTKGYEMMSNGVGERMKVIVDEEIPLYGVLLR